jgi:hypothetical protein
MPLHEDLPSTIELWSEGYQRLEETIARAADYLTAKAAFEAAVKRRPTEPIMLRDRARIVLRSHPDG